MIIGNNFSKIDETRINRMTFVGHSLESMSIEGVYLLYDGNNDLIYVGQSKNISSRLRDHCSNNNREWRYCQIIPIHHQQHRFYTEAILIKYLNPKNNKAKGYPKEYSFGIEELVRLSSKLTDALEHIDFMSNMYVDEVYNESKEINNGR